MSTEKTDTTPSANDAGALSDPIESEGDIPNGETVEISKKDVDDLAGLLQSYRAVILAHEERLLEHEARITVLENKKPVKLEIPRGRSR